MNTYNIYFQSRVLEVTAATLFEAKVKAIELLRPRKKQLGLISVVLVKVGDIVIEHSGAELRITVRIAHSGSLQAGNVITYQLVEHCMIRIQACDSLKTAVSKSKMT